MNDKLIQHYIEFIKEICAQYECTEAETPLVNGFNALCEAAFQHPTFEDPAQHKAYWKNVFFRLKTIGNVVIDLQSKLWNDLHDRSAMVTFKRSEKRDKSGYVLKGVGRGNLAVELSFTMPYPENYNILVTGKVGKQKFETVIPETELDSTEWKYDGAYLKDRLYLRFDAYNTILQAILSASAVPNT